MAPAQVITMLLRVGIGGLFVYAGALKVWDPQQFAIDVDHYELTPWTFSVLIAVYLPWLEVFAGLALVVRRLQLGALLALTGLTVVFLCAISSAWARGLDITCGCFRREAEAMQTNFPLLIGRDLLLLAGILALLVIEWRNFKLQMDADGPGTGQSKILPNR